MLIVSLGAAGILAPTPTVLVSSIPVPDDPRWTPTLPPAPTCPEGLIGIGGGSFVMGTQSKWEGDMDERPAHGVWLSPYCLDRTEVTLGAYRACERGELPNGRCPAAPTTVRHEEADHVGEERDSRYCNARLPDRDDHPLNCVDWTTADAFCRARGARLPTEAEWELAARGPERRKYPFREGLPLGPSLLNVLDRRARERIGKPSWPVLLETDDGYETTAPVGSYPEGATPQGVLDLAGNVWEWVSDYYAPYPDSEQEQVNPKGPPEGPSMRRRVLRGGGFLVTNPSMVRSAQRNANPPEVRSQDIGFRCASDPR